MSTPKKTTKSSKTKVPAEGKVSPRPVNGGDKPGSLPGQEPAVIVFGKDDPKPVLPDCLDTAADDEPCWPYDEPKKEFKDPLLTRLDHIIELLEGTLTVDKKGLKLDSPWWEKFLGKD